MKTWSNIAWFTALGFLRPATQFFLIPLYLAKITPKEYGILALVTLFSALVGSLSGMKLDMAANTFYFDFNQDRNKLFNYLGQVFSLSLFVSLCIFGILFFLGHYLFGMLFQSDEVLYHPFGILAVAQILLSSSNAIYFSFLKNELKVKKFVLLNASATMLTIILQAILIIYFEKGILGILLGNLIPTGLIFIYIILNNQWLLNFRLDFQQLRPSLIFGLGFLPISFLSIFEKHIDKIILEQYLNLEQVGLYALLLSIVGLFEILVRAYQNAIRPLVYQSLKNNDSDTAIIVNSYLSTYVSIGLIGLSGVLLVGSHFHWLTSNPKYLSIIAYFPFAIIASIPLIVIRYQILVLLFYKKTIQLSVLTILKVLAMLLLMMYLIPQYGIYGAIGSLAISYILYFFLFRIIEQKYGVLPLHYGKVCFQCLPLLLLVSFYLYFSSDIKQTTASVLIFILTVFPIILIERKRIMSLILRK